MANTFKSYLTAGVTTQTTIHTAPSLTQTAVIGLSVANTTTASTSVDVSLTRGSTVVSVIKGAVIPAADSLILYGGDQKLVMQAGDLLKLTSSGAVDAIVSVLEVN
jgi:hypothetical protein